MSQSLRVTFVIFLAVTSTARAECPESDTPCLLQEEGLAFYRAGNFAAAADKFKASIAAKPSARAYLGYAQALEGLGRVALGYETLLEAKKLNDADLTTAPDDVDLVGRADRIKYKLAELLAKTAIVALTLPDFVKRDELVSVQRKDEGDIPDPLAHTIIVAAGKQEMVATLKDGRAVTFIVNLGQGMTGTMLIPFPAPAPKVVEKPTTTIIQQFVTERPSTKAISVDAGGVGPNDNVNLGVGAALRFEHRGVPHLVLGGRVGVFDHLKNDFQFSAFEVDALASAYFAPVPIFYVGVDVGGLVYSRSAQLRELTDVRTFFYPTLGGSAGLHLDRIDIRVSGLKHFEVSNPVLAIPVRMMVSIGVEVMRR